MRKALTLLILLSILFCLGMLACQKGNSIDAVDFNGSDPIVKEFRIGSTAVNAGETINIPLELVDNFTFILNGEVDPITFLQFLEIRINVVNLDCDNSLECQGSVILRNSDMQANGYFDISEDGRTVEYRMNHSLDELWMGGLPIDPPVARPGDTLEITVERIVGRDKGGDWFAFQLDTFRIAYVASAHL